MKELAERLDEKVAVARLGFTLQGQGGLVEELVQQAFAEARQPVAVLGRQVAQLLEDALQLGRAHRLHPPPEFLQHRHDRQGVVPVPEARHLLLDDLLGPGNLGAALRGRLPRHRAGPPGGGAAMPPAPGINARRPRSSPKIFPASEPAADGAEAAPRPIAVSVRTRAPTSSADWNSRCSTAPARPRDSSQASRT